MTLDNYLTAGAFDHSGVQTKTKSSLYEQLKILYQQGNWIEFIKTANLAKMNIIISGGTGTGKTTFLNACLKAIPEQ